MTSDASAVEHQTEIGSDSAARLASWSCTCGASEVITFARPLGEPVALRLAGIGASQHKQDAATAAARDDRMCPDDVPAELLDLACDRMFGTPPEAGDDRRGMAEALAAVLPAYEPIVLRQAAERILLVQPELDARDAQIGRLTEELTALLAETKPQLAQTAATLESIEKLRARAHADREKAEAERDELKIENALLVNDQMELAKAKQETERLRGHILDIDAHATPYGDLPQDPGYVGTYLLTAGALHRALGKIGHTAPSCAAEAERDRLRAAAQEVAGILFNALIHPEPTACMGRVPSVSSECGVCRARAILEAALDPQEEPT